MSILNQLFMEVQSHGNDYEDLVIKRFTGLTKKEYDKLKGKGGYTSSMDIVKGLLSNKDRSVKTAKNNKVDCGDILRRMNEKEYEIIVGQYRQDGGNKVVHTEYVFNIKPEDYDKLWGTMKYELVEEFNKFVKSIPAGREAQQATKGERTRIKNNISCKDALMVIHPKVDSKSQRRVQCSFKIDQMISSGVEYTKKDINIVIKSSARKFNK
mgnify:FL=1